MSECVCECVCVSVCECVYMSSKDIMGRMTSSLNLIQLCNGNFLFFKVHHPSTEKPKALVGFKPRTEPGLSTRHSNSTSAFYVIMHVLLL